MASILKVKKEVIKNTPTGRIPSLFLHPRKKSLLERWNQLASNQALVMIGLLICKQKPGIIIDYDKDGNIVRLEVVNASEKIGKAENIIYEFA